MIMTNEVRQKIVSSVSSRKLSENFVLMLPMLMPSATSGVVTLTNAYFELQFAF